MTAIYSLSKIERLTFGGLVISSDYDDIHLL